MKIYIAMSEGRRGAFLPMRDTKSGSIRGFRSPDAAWESIFKLAREEGIYKAAKVDTIDIPEPQPDRRGLDSAYLV